MKKGLKILFLLVLFLIPSVIEAKVSYNYNDAYSSASKYIKTLKYSDILIKEDNTSYFITEDEFNQIGGTTSYLQDGQVYWTLAKAGNEKVYQISKNPAEADKSSEAGLRTALLIERDNGITGNGTYTDPWVFADIIEVKVAFTSNSSSCGTPSKSTTTVIVGRSYNSKEVFPEFTVKDQYTNFNGWYTEENGKGRNITETSYVNEKENHTLYAYCTAKTYKVVYNANGGTGSMQDSTFAYNSSNALRANTFTKSGYDFKGWATSAGGSVVYKNNASINNTNASVSTINLYAVWQASNYTITYNCNGGGGTAPAASTHVVGDTSVLRTNTCTPKTYEYKFLGWSKTASATTASYANGALASSVGATAGSTTKLYAIWKQYNYVARIGTVYYETLQAAFNAVPTNNVLTDVYTLKSFSQSATLAANKYARLNINSSHTITGTVTNNSKIILAGGGKITNTSASAFISTGTSTISNVTLMGYMYSNTNFAVINSGNMTINHASALIKQSAGTWGRIVKNTGTLTITAGKIYNDSSDGGFAIYSEGGVVNASGSAILDVVDSLSRAICGSSATIKINGTTGVDGVCNYGGGSITMTNVTMHGNSIWPISDSEASVLTMTNTSVKASGTPVNLSEDFGNSTITGCTLKSDSYGIRISGPSGLYNVNNSLTINNTTITTDKEYGRPLYAQSYNSTITIKGTTNITSTNSLEPAIINNGGIMNIYNSVYVKSYGGDCDTEHSRQVMSTGRMDGVMNVYGGNLGRRCSSS